MSLLDALLLDPYPLNVYIAARTDGIKGSGTINDPWDGSSVDKFDGILSAIPASTKARIHLSPGTFQTRGYADGVTGAGWSPQEKWSIVGSGLDLTILQLVAGSTVNQHYFAIGHPLGSSGTRVDYLSVTDLTIDCNLPTTSVACGAIRIMGDHVRIRRVKAKNWGTRSSSQPTCSVLAVIIADPEAANTAAADAGIEDCMVVEPSANNTGSANLLSAGSKDFSTDQEVYANAPFIRNCFVDCGAASVPSAAFRGFYMASCRGGIVEANHIHNTTFGGPWVDKLSTPEIIIRNNYLKNVLYGIVWTMGTTMAANRTLSSLSRDGTKATATVNASSSVSHGLAIGDRVKIQTSSASDFEGFWEITEIPQPNQFRYLTDKSSGSATGPSMYKVFGVDKAVVEGNTIELAPIISGSPPLGVQLSDNSLITSPPPYVHGEIIIRNNKIRYLDGLLDPAYVGTGMQLSSAKHLFVRDNVIECVPASPLQNFRCGTVKYFNNRTPSGALIRGYDGATTNKYSELETDAEDALLLTLI